MKVSKLELINNIIKRSKVDLKQIFMFSNKSPNIHLFSLIVTYIFIINKLLIGPVLVVYNTIFYNEGQIVLVQLNESPRIY